MSTTVHVWLTAPDTVGHTSVTIGSTHVSFWPRGTAGAKGDIKKGQDHEPGWVDSLRFDQRVEKKPADCTIQLDGLNEAAMLAVFDEMKNNGASYNMKDHNCSTVVAVLLETGSGMPPPYAPKLNVDEHTTSLMLRLWARLRYFSASIPMWTPEAVRDYAQAIARRPRP